MLYVNNTARIISVGNDATLIPFRMTEVNEKTMKHYPRIMEMLESGEITAVDKGEAAKVQESLDSKTLEQLKEIAAEKGIDTKGLKNKDDFLVALGVKPNGEGDA